VTSAPFLSRHFGDYLLVAQLSEDALGTVYRALYAADERRFVRLRILQGPELSREALVRAIKAYDSRSEALVHDTMVTQPQLSVAEDLPFLTWDETSGWTLDVMLARVRALGIRIPAEYALLIGERIAAALEHAHRCVVDGLPSDHGLLWPGFVSISHDAAVRVGGFGIAEGVLPTISAPRLSAEIGPYVAPEARAFAEVGSNADVYSLGAILVELLTGRRPSAEAPSAELRAGDARSDELASFLKRCLAPPEQRFVDAADAHRALQQLLTGNPFSLYTANLSLFLYKLLNPESQSIVSSSDFESTNPVQREKTAPATPPALEDRTAGAETRRRRKGDLAPAEESATTAQVPVPVLRDSPDTSRVATPAAATPDPEVAPAALQERAALLLSDSAPEAAPPPIRAWVRAAAPLAAAAGVALAAFLVASQVQSVRSAATASRLSAPPPPPPAVEAIPESAPAVMAPAPAVAAFMAPPPAGTVAHASPRVAPKPARKVVQTELRHPAEDQRLRAALARIEADRVNARESAGDLFGEGRRSEQEGERLLREKDYDAAQLAFSKAARLFQKAQERSWEERLRQATLSPTTR
jgi:serine/threonine protein kinase